jgi:MFS family permease
MPWYAHRMPLRGRWIPILFLATAFALGYMARQSLSSIFPLLRADLGFSEAQLGLTTTVFNWVYGLSNGLGGHVADRMSKRWVIMASLVAAGAALALTGLASSPWTLLAGRSLMGLALSFYIPAAMVLIAAWHGPETRSRAITLHSVGQSVGVIAGGYYGAVVGESLGWRPMLWMLGAAMAAYAVVIRLVLTKDTAPEDAPATESAPRVGLRQLLLVPSYALICLCSIAVGANVWILYTWLPDLLSTRFALPLAEASLLATTSLEIPMMGGLLLGAFFGDWLARRWKVGRLYLMATGLVLACGFFYGIAVADSVMEVRVATGAYAVAKGFYSANYVACVFDLIAPSSHGLAVGSVNMISSFGGSLSPVLLGALKATYGTASIFGGFAVLGVLFAVGLAVAGHRTFRAVALTSPLRS